MGNKQILSVLGSIVAAAVVAGCGGHAGGSADRATGLIAFTHQNRSGKDQIFVMQADGSGRRALTTQDSLDPVWSPDGAKLAFLDHDQRLVVMNADGSGRRIVSREQGIAEDEIASWSPDGRQLVFGAKLEVGPDVLFVVNADGTGKRRLGVRGLGPDWSPDGKHIVFTDREGRVAVIGADGRGLRRLTPDFACSSDPPRWSPDGKKIAFIVSADCLGTDAPIAVMNADGTRRKPVTHGSGYYGAPSWSPDGRQIVFSRGPDFGAVGNLYVADLDGGHVRQITTDGGNFDPSWQQPHE